jgi:perosamine synthetase
VIFIRSWLKKYTMKTLTVKNSKTMNNLKPRLFYHLPPTAVSITLDDIRCSITALIEPKYALEEFVDALVHRVVNSNCYLTDSGRSALLLILLTIKNRSQRTKVILPAYSCPTVAQAVLQAGLQPVFCDMSTDTLDMDRGHLQELVDDQTLAIIPTHLYGLPMNVRDLIAIGRASGIHIIEDAAQAFGAEIGGKPVGTIGDFGFYSMGRGKCIPTGHGGIILARDAFAGDLKKTISETVSGKTKPEIASIISYLAYGLATTPFGWWFIVRSPLNPANARHGSQKAAVNYSRASGARASGHWCIHIEPD